jgi:hypothetical protein
MEINCSLVGTNRVEKFGMIIIVVVVVVIRIGVEE